MNFIEEFIAKRALKKARKEIEMGGWKTKVAGIGAIMGGAALAISGLVGESFNFDAIKQGVVGIIAGLGMLGLGHKLDKNTEAVKGGSDPAVRELLR